MLPAASSRSNSQCHTLHPEVGGSRVLQNIGVLRKHFMVSEPRGPEFESPPPQKSSELLKTEN